MSNAAAKQCPSQAQRLNALESYHQDAAHNATGSSSADKGGHCSDGQRSGSENVVTTKAGMLTFQ